MHDDGDQGSEHGDTVTAEERKMYLSIEFDQQLDVDLARLDQLDRDIETLNVAGELRKEYQALYDEVRSLIRSLHQRWDFQSGWYSEEPFRGSKADERVSDCVVTAQILLHDLKALLAKLPPGGNTWKDILEMIEWTAGAWSFLAQFTDCLGVKPSDKELDSSQEDSEE